MTWGMTPVVRNRRSAKDFNKAQQEAYAALRKYPNDRAVKSMHPSPLADLGKTDQAIAEAKTLSSGKSDRETWLALAPTDVDQGDVAKVQKKLEGAKVRLARENQAKQ